MSTAAILATISICGLLLVAGTALREYVTFQAQQDQPPPTAELRVAIDAQLWGLWLPRGPALVILFVVGPLAALVGVATVIALLA